MNRFQHALALAAIGTVLLSGVDALHAQSRSTVFDRQRPPCGAGVVHAPNVLPESSYVHQVAFRNAGVRAGQLKIEFVGHSTFFITSPAGVTVATDYNDFYRADTLPNFATMSGWHHNHTTGNIDPSINHALKGWDTGLGTPRFDRRLKDLRVYNLAANLPSEKRFFRFPTSAFVIESNGLCVAHLGLLSHVLTDRDSVQLGRIDILMTPIEQVVTLSFEEIVHNIRLLKPKIVLPMHFNSENTVEGFLADIASVFPVIRRDSSILIADRAKLPEKTEIHYLRPPAFGLGFR